MLKFYMSKYCKIGTYDDDMYLYRYICVMRIHIYHTANMVIIHVFWFCKKFKVASYEFFLLYQLLVHVR